MRDTDNVNAFLAEFDQYEKNFDSKDPNKRLPNYIVMASGRTHGVDDDSPPSTWRLRGSTGFGRPVSAGGGL